MNILSSAIAVVALSSTLALGSQPNILIILLDDAGYNDFGFMGSKDLATPHIDALARDGVILTDAHVTASVSGPSRCGILTGRYQQRGGYECNYGEILGMDLNETTIADVFKKNGYQTICVGKWHQGNGAAYHPNKRGFNEFYGMIQGGHSYFYDPKTNKIQRNGKLVAFDQYLSYELGDQAIQYLNRFKEQPFMMYLAYNAVHSPYVATKEDMARFEGHPRQTLAAMTYAVDKSIGEVIKALKANGQYDNTLIFFFVDNGGAPSNKISNAPLKGFKGNKFEGGHRVPFFVTFGDKLPAGTQFHGLSSSLDVMATSLAAAGIDSNTLKNKLDGVNLLPYLKGEKKGDPHQVLFWRKDSMAAMRMGDYKYIRVKDVGARLYQLDDDLGESRDRRKDKPDIAQQMEAGLSAWESELHSPLLWDEGIWDDVTKQIHNDLMNNRKVQALYPGQYQKIFGKKNKNQ